MASLADKDRRRFLIEKLNTEWTRLSIRLQAISQFFSLADKRDEVASYPHLKIKQANDQANFDYVPQLYKGRVAVIRPKGCFVGETDPSLGWSNIIPNGLEIYDLPVYPRGILIEPFCRVLAQSLKLCLEKI